jgi:hypothetical protein
MLKKTCHACNKDRKKNKLVYDAQLNAYCKHSHECNADHPNSTINLIKNGKLVSLYDHDKSLELFAETNNSDTIKHMANPITLRLSDVRQALHIEKVCAERNISISDYIRGLIDADMQTIEIAEAPKQTEAPKQKTNESELIF